MVAAWEVRWVSRSAEYSSSTKPEVKLFITEQEANDFADALKAAFKLIGNSGKETEVHVIPQVET